MLDLDAVIIGGGPAGLTAGLYLTRNKVRTVLLEKGPVGGPMLNYELIENYPGFSSGISGAKLATEMMNQASQYGLQIELAEVKGLRSYSNGIYIDCGSGVGYMSKLVIIASGSRPKKLGLPNEDYYLDKGLFHCALCDGSKYENQVIIVCGGGDSGVTEALNMTRLASHVVILEAKPALTCSAILKERASANSKLQILCGTRVEAILGSRHVEGVKILNVQGKKETLEANGVLIHVGQEPNTSYLEDLVSLDSVGHIIVNDKMETAVPYILAAGDIRSGSQMQISTAVGDGATAAITGLKKLQES
jgi:thioredoxin reductase (NADPH)